MIPMIVPCAPRVSHRVWCHVQGLLVGTILAPGSRTVTAIRRVLG
jgi:hypothetical protein